MATKPKPESGLITISKAATLLEISDRYVRKLIADGFIPKSSQRNMVSLVGAVRGYIRLLKDEERRASKSAAASEVQKVRAEEIRLRIAREQGLLVELASAEAVVADVVGTLRSELAGIASAATRCLDTRQTIENLIEAAVVRSRERFAKQRDELKKGKLK